MKRLWLLLFVTILLVGCSKQAMEEIDIKSADKETKNFVLDHIAENGAYLLQREGMASVLLINNKNVESSMKLYTIEDVDIAMKEGTCTISYQMVPVKEAEKADDFKLYKFKLEEDIDTLELMRNNQLTSFRSIDIES